MTKESLAALITGREIGDEVTPAESIEAKNARLVVVYGASDDLTEFSGFIPHATFEVFEDGEVWCRGIVFSMDDLGVQEVRNV